MVSLPRKQTDAMHLMYSFLLLIICSCSAPPVRQDEPQLPVSHQEPEVMSRRVIVLGGGLIQGAAGIGVLEDGRLMKRQSVHLVGVQFGGFIAALYAKTKTDAQFAWMWLVVSGEDYLNPKKEDLLHYFRGAGRDRLAKRLRPLCQTQTVRMPTSVYCGGHMIELGQRDDCETMLACVDDAREDVRVQYVPLVTQPHDDVIIVDTQEYMHVDGGGRHIVPAATSQRAEARFAGKQAVRGID